MHLEDVEQNLGSVSGHWAKSYLGCLNLACLVVKQNSYANMVVQCMEPRKPSAVWSS